MKMKPPLQAYQLLAIMFKCSNTTGDAIKIMSRNLLQTDKRVQYGELSEVYNRKTTMEFSMLAKSMLGKKQPSL